MFGKYQIKSTGNTLVDTIADGIWDNAVVESAKSIVARAMWDHLEKDGFTEGADKVRFLYRASQGG